MAFAHRKAHTFQRTRTNVFSTTMPPTARRFRYEAGSRCALLRRSRQTGLESHVYLPIS